MKNLLFIITLLSLSSNAINLEGIYNVIKYVESNNKTTAIGDNGEAFGIVQIHKICVDDVNRIYNTDYKHQDVFNEACAIEIFNLYLIEGIRLYVLKYKREPTEQDIVRFWNGGIYSGHLRKTTLKYWYKYLRVKFKLNMEGKSENRTNKKDNL